MGDAAYIAKNIKRMREERNWYQEDLADKLGVTDKAVSAWENGRAVPRYKILEQLCTLFGCRMHDLTLCPDGPDYIVTTPEGQFTIEHRNAMDESEARLLRIYQKLAPESQRRLIDMAIDLMMEGK